VTYPSPPYDGTLIFASTRKIITIMTPLKIPHFVCMHLQDGSRDSREVVLTTTVIRIKRKLGMRRWVVVCAELSLQFLCLLKEGGKASLWDHDSGRNILCRSDVSRFRWPLTARHLPCRLSSSWCRDVPAAPSQPALLRRSSGSVHIIKLGCR
jgi:hypothetical protein